MTTPEATLSKRQVLIVEDEAPLREVVRLHLTLAGFEVTVVGDGMRALELMSSARFDLIVLDVMLPRIDGITLCRAVRSGGPNQRAAILMLTAMDTESDRVLGLDSGADDYLTKPFGMRELIARVSAVLRRSAGVDLEAEAPASSHVRSREVVLDLDRREVLVRGHLVDLTKQEFDLLYLLASRPGVVFSRAALMARLWSGDTYVTERTVDRIVSRLRGKLELDAHDPSLILTAWGVGYKFADVD